MATRPYFRCPLHSSAGAPESDAVAGLGLGAQEMAALTTAAAGTALVSQDRCAAAGRPRTRRNSSGSGKQQQQQQQQKGGGGGAKKPPQRGLGVAELERLRCGGDPLRELAGAQFRPLMHVHCNHHHHHDVPASAFDARYCSPLQLVQPQPPPASPRPVAAGCYVHHPACRAWLPEGLSSVSAGAAAHHGQVGPHGTGAGDDHQAPQLLPPLAPEHPSSQSTICWRPTASSSSSCPQSGHRCDLCARRTTRAFVERAAPPPPQPSPSPTATTLPDYCSIYNLATAMAATTRQGDAAFVVRDTKRGASPGDAPVKNDVGEIEFFPAASTHHACTSTGLDRSEFAAPLSSSSHGAGSCAAAPLDLSLRL